MLRFGALCQFTPKALMLVLKCGRELAFTVSALWETAITNTKLENFLISEKKQVVAQDILRHGLRNISDMYQCNICSDLRILR